MWPLSRVSSKMNEMITSIIPFFSKFYSLKRNTLKNIVVQNYMLHGGQGQKAKVKRWFVMCAGRGHLKPSHCGGWGGLSQLDCKRSREAATGSALTSRHACLLQVRLKDFSPSFFESSCRH